MFSLGLPFSPSDLAAVVEGALEEDDGLLLCRTPFGGRPAGTIAAGSVEATVELFLQAAPM